MILRCSIDRCGRWNHRIWQWNTYMYSRHIQYYKFAILSCLILFGYFHKCELDKWKCCGRIPMIVNVYNITWTIVWHEWTCGAVARIVRHGTPWRSDVTALTHIVGCVKMILKIAFISIFTHFLTLVQAIWMKRALWLCDDDYVPIHVQGKAAFTNSICCFINSLCSLCRCLRAFFLLLFFFF